MWPYIQHVLASHGVEAGVALGGGVLFLASRYLPRPLLELAAARTRDPDRRLLYLEMIRLRHKDAALLPSYLPQPAQQTPGDPDPPAAGPAARLSRRAEPYRSATRRGP